MVIWVSAHTCHLLFWKDRWEAFEEEIFDGGGNGVYGNVQTSNINVVVLAKKTEKKIFVNRINQNNLYWKHDVCLYFKILSTLMCLKKNPVLSFGTSRNSLIPSHTFTKSSTVLSFLPILFWNCLPASLGVVYLPYEIVWLYSNSLPYFSQMFNRTLIPSYTLPKSSTVLSLGLVFL